MRNEEEWFVHIETELRVESSDCFWKLGAKDDLPSLVGTVVPWMPDNGLALCVFVASYVEYLTIVLINDVCTVELVSMPPRCATSVESSRARFSAVLDLK